MLDNQGLLNNNYDTIVIGAGISGLTAALIFAKEGKRVALFEKDLDIAPLIRPYSRKGSEFSPGLHISGWMGEEEIIFTFLRYLGISDGVEKELNYNGIANVMIGTNKFHIPKGFDNLEKSLISYFPESREAVTNYVRLLKEVIDQSFYFNWEITPGKNQHNEFSANHTLKDCLLQYNASPSLIDLLGTLNYVLIGSKADEVPFSVHAFVLGGFYHSPGFFTVHGINRMLLNYKRELSRYGVSLFLNSEVSEILTDNNRNISGIKTRNGVQYNAPTVIASFNPKLLNNKLKHQVLRPIYRRRLDEAENTFGFYVAFYKITACNDLPIENLAYYDPGKNITLTATINYYGQEKIFCAFLADNNQNIPLHSEERKNLAKQNYEILETIIFDKYPGLQGNLILLDFVKPWSFERYTKTINGSAYGIKQTINQIGFQHRVPIKGLYLVGQAIYPGFLGSMISGFSLGCELFEVDKFWPRVINQ